MTEGEFLMEMIQKPEAWDALLDELLDRLLVADHLAAKICVALTFFEMWKSSEFLNLMTPGMEAALDQVKEAQKTGQGKIFSDDQPIRIWIDFSGKASSRRFPLEGRTLSGPPIIGSDMLEGTGARLRYSTEDIQFKERCSVIGHESSEMALQGFRKKVCRKHGKRFGRLIDRTAQVQLYGVCGVSDDGDWIVPQESDPDFNDIVTNPVHPPTDNRYCTAGSAEGPGGRVENLTAADALTLDDLLSIHSWLDSMPHKPRSIRVGEGDYHGFYLLLLTPSQWKYISDTENPKRLSWHALESEAARLHNLYKHPAFADKCGVLDRLIIREMPCAIRFNAGDRVKLTDSKNGEIIESKVPAGVTVERALLLGAQAIGMAFGRIRGSGAPGFPVSWGEKVTNHGINLETGSVLRHGLGKLRFTDPDPKAPKGTVTDNGVIAIDSHAPDPMSAAGKALQAALNNV